MTRSARPCRSSIIFRIARRTIAISIASIITAEALDAHGASVDMLAEPRAPRAAARRHSRPQSQDRRASRSVARLRRSPRRYAPRHGGRAPSRRLPKRSSRDSRRRSASDKVHAGKLGFALAGARGALGALMRHALHPPPHDCGRIPMTMRPSPSTAPLQTQTVAVKSSFYLAMRILEPARRDAMYAIYSFLPRGRRYRRRRRRSRRATHRARRLAARSRRALCRPHSSQNRLSGGVGAPLQSRPRRFRGGDRRHDDGCRRGYSRAGLGEARSLLRPRGERRRPAVGARLRPRRRMARRIVHGAEAARLSPRPRASSSPIFCAISTRTPRAGGCICRARRWRRRASRIIAPHAVLASPDARRRLRAGDAARARAFRTIGSRHGAACRSPA